MPAQHGTSGVVITGRASAMSTQVIEWIAYGLLLVALVIAAIYSVAATPRGWIGPGSRTTRPRRSTCSEKGRGPMAALIVAGGVFVVVFCAVCYVGLVIAGANAERRL